MVSKALLKSKNMPIICSFFARVLIILSHDWMIALKDAMIQLKDGPWKPKVMTNSHPVLPRPRAIQVRWLLHYYIDLIWRHRRAPRRIGGQTWHCTALPCMQPEDQPLHAIPPDWPGPRARTLTERLSANALCQHNTCAQRDKSWPPTWRHCYGDVTSMHNVYWFVI